MTTRVTEMLGIQYPVIQGGMAWVAEYHLVSAVSQAGGLGIIGAGGASAEFVRGQIRKVKERTEKPFGVNLMLMNPEADAIAQVIVEEGVKVVTTGAGNPGRYLPMWREAGVTVIPVVASVAMARMMERDDFQNRFRGGVPIGLHEFFYPLMQAYDSVELRADLELGGTDQTFNILMGRQLQRDRKQEPQAALFMPLLEGTDGTEKMSKSLGNYIGISEDARTMFTKVMQVPDALILKYFELATDILPEDLDKVREALADGCNPRDCKLVLAETITSLYHSPEDTAEAGQFFRQAFTEKAVPEQARILEAVLESGTLFDCIRPLVNAGIVESGAQFRRLVAQGGVQKNGIRVEKLEEPVKSGDVLKVGKRRFVRIRLC